MTNFPIASLHLGCQKQSCQQQKCLNLTFTNYKLTQYNIAPDNGVVTKLKADYVYSCYTALKRLCVFTIYLYFTIGFIINYTASTGQRLHLVHYFLSQVLLIVKLNTSTLNT